jgi:fructose/tagatose bisphosphate aldolase
MGAHIRRGARGLKKQDGPAIVVHSLSHALAALTAASEASRPIIILSAPDSGIYAGPGWFKALVDAAREAVPEANATFILDCGDDAGAAQGAIRAGIEALIFSGRADVAERLAEIATARGLRLLTKRPTALFDLGDMFFADDETLRRHCADRLASCSAIC